MRNLLTSSLGYESSSLKDIWIDSYIPSVNLKGFGAKGDGITDDSEVFQLALNLFPSIHLPEGNYKLTKQIDLPSNRLISGMSAVITSTAVRAFYFAKGTYSVCFRDLTIIGSGGTCFYCDGVGGGAYSDNVRRIELTNLVVVSFGLGCYFKSTRRFSITDSEFNCVNGIVITDKCAESTIVGCNIVQYGEGENTIGVHCYAQGVRYPEGISITSSLIYHFDTNLKIDDLYIGLFSNLYLDGLVGINADINYLFRTEGLRFTNCWFFASGVVFGSVAQAAPKMYRSSFVNCQFNSQKAGVVLNFKRFTFDVKVSNFDVDGDGVSSVVAVLVERNCENISCSQASFRFVDSVYQNRFIGNYNSISDFVTNDVVNPYYLEYPVSFSNCQGLQSSVKVNIPAGTVINKGEEIVRVPAFFFSPGVYKIVLSYSGFVITNSGLNLVTLATASGINSKETYKTLRSTESELSFTLQIDNVLTSDLILKSEGVVNGISGTFEDFNYLTIDKIS